MKILHFFTNLLLRFNVRLPETFLKEEIVRFFAEFSSERIVEIPLIIRSIPKKKEKILDVGCRYSLLPINLASLGHEVYGIDINKYHRKHPNFRFFQEDILNSSFSEKSFDTVISLSTLEHIGLARYGEDKNDRGDIDTVTQIQRLLKKEGVFLCSLPFGKRFDGKWYRVYDLNRVHQLFKEFVIIEELAFVEKNDSWIPSSPEQAEKVDSSERARAILFVQAQRK